MAVTGISLSSVRQDGQHRVHPRLGGCVVVGVAILPGQHASRAEVRPAARRACARTRRNPRSSGRPEPGWNSAGFPTRGKLSAPSLSMNPAALSGGSPSPQVLVTMSRFDSLDNSAASYFAMSSIRGARPPCFSAAVFTFFANPSALPVWLPNSTNTGAGGAARAGAWVRPSRAAGSAAADENKPAMKPLSHWRCSSLKGAVSGINGTRRRVFASIKIEMVRRG